MINEIIAKLKFYIAKVHPYGGSSSTRPHYKIDSIKGICPMLAIRTGYMKIAAILLLLLCSPLFVNAVTVPEKIDQNYRGFISLSPNNPYFLFILLFGVLLAIGSFFKPKFGLVVMLFFIMVSTDMPLGKDASTERTTTIRIEDIVLLLVSAGWLLNRAKTRTLAIIKKVPVNKGIIIMALAIVFATFIGYLQGTVTLQQGILFSMKRLEYFWIFFMTLNIMDDYKEVKLAVKILLVVSIVVGFLGLGQSFIFPVVEMEGGTTATAGLGRANTLADFLLIVLGLSLGILLFTKEKRLSALCLIGFAVFLFGIIMTKSRGAYVSIPPMVFIAYLISRNRKIVLLTFAFLILGGVYFASTMVSDYRAEFLIEKHRDDIKTQFTSIGNVVTEGAQADSSFNSRYLAWKNVIPEIKNYPIFGHGVGSMNLGYLDNQYFHELYDTGVVGLLSLLYMNIIIFLSCLKFYLITRDSFSKGMALGFICAQVGVLFHGITITNFYTIINMEAFWFILALVMVLYHHEKSALKTVKAESIVQTEENSHPTG